MHYERGGHGSHLVAPPAWRLRKLCCCGLVRAFVILYCRGVAKKRTKKKETLSRGRRMRACARAQHVQVRVARQASGGPGLALASARQASRGRRPAGPGSRRRAAGVFTVGRGPAGDDDLNFGSSRGKAWPGPAGMKKNLNYDLVVVSRLK